ncbi:MAG: GNAT family N-acetyltransferase [Lachnospiraceae bacterium]
MVSLKKISSNNIWNVVHLSVNENQKSFVATNTESILEAYATIADGNAALPFAIYNDDMLIGFVMFGYGSTGDDDEPQIAEKNYCIWRFMIDSKYQGYGYGKESLKASLDYLKTMPCGPAQFCWLSYEPENVVAKALYTSAGFVENGEICGEEIVSVRRL